jgi:hypothetical protein
MDSKYGPLQQVNVSAIPYEQPPQAGAQGKTLYSLKGNVRYYYLIIVAYTVAAFGVLIWAVSGPPLPGGRRVLRAGSLKVDSFYSGLALSALLTPAAILIRKISKDVGMLHPFALAAQKPVKASDFDRIMDPGPLSLPTIARYSFFRAMVQAVLMLSGALLVPIGTLIVTVGPYAAQNLGLGVVGLPTTGGSGAMTMSISMELGFGDSNTPVYGSLDTFLPVLTDSYLGAVVSASGLTSNTPSRLGPIQTSNLTFDTDVQYNGLVTFEWAANCEYVGDDEIKYTAQAEESAWIVNFTWPDGTMNTSDVWNPAAFFWSDSKKNADGIPIGGGTTYIAASCAMNATAQLPGDRTGLVMTDGVWISRAKCTPSIQWHVSSCWWNGTVMGNCTDTPNANTTALDNEGLDALQDYMTAVAWSLYMGPHNGDGAAYLFGLPSYQLPLNYYAGTGDHQYRAPSLEDYGNFFGLIMRSIQSVTTAGYFGTAQVPTWGTTPQTVYIARMYILGLVLVIFLAVTLAGMAEFLFNKVKQLPYRKTSFLTIAGAVRGPWWDQQMYGKCAVDESGLRKTNTVGLMFGADAACPEHIGLAPQVYPIQKNKVYL